MKRDAAEVVRVDDAPCPTEKKRRVERAPAYRFAGAVEPVEPWFVPVVGQAEDIFGLVFQYISLDDYRHYCTLPAVCQWFHNVFWASLKSLDSWNPDCLSLL